MRSPKDLIQWLDLTRLVEADTSENVRTFCEQARTPFGNVAAVCVYTEFIAEVAPLFSNTDIQIASVVNFPHGQNPIEVVVEKIQDAIEHGATEIDVVMPYFLLREKKDEEVFGFVKQCRQSCGENITMKVIIESGELQEPALIKTASDIVIESKADFIKTSTGKTKTGATLEAAKIILSCIKNSNSDVGIKISGGIRTVSSAFEFVDLISNEMGEQWLIKNHFRIGASSLLDEILKLANTSTEKV